MNANNQVTLTGHLLQDCELAYSCQGVPRCTFRLIVPREGSQAVDPINVGIWGQEAEALCQELRAGRRVQVQGHLRVWQDGQREVVGVVATCLRLLDELPATTRPAAS